jgi:carboxyl-terminal processing protease
MERLILDLRWNPGGFLDQAVRLAGKFINGHKKVVYTKGRLSKFDEHYFTDTFGANQVLNIPLIILINNASASAAEIVAGAIQDYDRGLIVGTTSFGKGLVQREFPLRDNSRLRLTISKYYTPSGRLIQKPYKDKSIEDYYQLAFDSTENKVNEDSIKNDIYFTSGGRKVFGSGGITPDVIVKYTGGSQSPKLSQKLNQHRIFFEVGSKYANHHKYLKRDFKGFVKNFTVSKELHKKIKSAASDNGIEINTKEFQNDIQYINTRLKSEIARSLWDNEKYYQILMSADNQYLKALILFSEAEKILAEIK